MTAFIFFLFALFSNAFAGENECTDFIVPFCEAEGSESLDMCQPCYTRGMAKRPGRPEPVQVTPLKERPRVAPVEHEVQFVEPIRTASSATPVQAPVPQVPLQGGKYAAQFATPVDSPFAVMVNWDTVAATDVCYVNPTYQTNNSDLMTVTNDTGRLGQVLVNGNPVTVVRMTSVPSGQVDPRTGMMIPMQGFAVQAATSSGRRGNQQVSVLAPGQTCYMTAPLVMGGQRIEVTLITQKVRGFAGTFLPTQTGELLYNVPVFEAERDTDALSPRMGRVERFVFDAHDSFR